MSSQGILFSVSQKIVAHLASLRAEDERLDYVQTEIAERYLIAHPFWCCELGEDWKLLHGCMTDGKLSGKGGTFPLTHVVLGGDRIYRGVGNLMIMKIQPHVLAVSRALPLISAEDFALRYHQIDEKESGHPKSPEEEARLWKLFQDSIEFWKTAANQSRSVILLVEN